MVDLAAIHLGALLVDDVEVSLMRDLPAGHADQLVLRIAEDLAQAAVDADELAVKPYVRYARAGELEGSPVALLALAQRRIGLLARSDVVEHGKRVERLAPRVALHDDGDVRPYRPAVLTHIALPDLDRFDLAFVAEAPALIHPV